MDLELDVAGIAHGGVGVARHPDGRVAFVADAIPGERVLARIAEEKKSFIRADTIRVLAASPDRVPHVWLEAGVDRDPQERAGGAEFGHIALARQRALKAEVLRDALARFGGIDAGRLAALPQTSKLVEAAPGDDAVNGLGWRTRVRLHVGADGRPGPYAARSHRVIRVSGLPLGVQAIRASGVLGEDFAGAPQLDVVAVGDAPARLIVGQQRPTAIVERVGEREFRVDDTGFWQVHHAAAGLLSAALREALDSERFDPAAANLDLYGGVGLFAAALGELGGPRTRVTSIESDARATEHARANLAEWPDADAETARVDQWVREAQRSARRFDGATIVLDPPRSGAGEGLAGAIAGLGAAQLVYIACDPVALARDTKVIEAGGYTMTRLRAFDLFPHTHHLEAIATFVPSR